MVLVPFTSEPRYRMGVVLDETTYLMDVHWNGRDEAWYFDVLTENAEPIYSGIKIVLGAQLGKMARKDPRFPQGMFVAADLTGANVDAGLEDLGTRIVVYYFSPNESPDESPV